MFIDEVKITLIAGAGGDGTVSYRREAHVENGGPFGGNGGKGGDVYLVGDSNTSTLLDFKYFKEIKADSGVRGGTKNKTGAMGENKYLRVPLGTAVYNQINNEFIGEVTTDGELLLVARGGKGGRGNTSFASNKNKCPDYAEKGDPGETLEARLVLKMVCDIGLIGLPSVGKSSIINTITRSKSKVGDYPFTTLSPNLGVLEVKDKAIIVADLPGLIENASLVEGLGLDFLKHIERSRAFVHVLDATSTDILKDYNTVRLELEKYNKSLILRNELIVVNKIDLVTDKDIKKITKIFKDKDICFISVYAYKNIDTLISKIVSLYNISKNVNPISEISHEEVGRELSNELYVTRENNIFVVTGEKLKLYFDRTTLANEYSLNRFINIIKKMGIEEKLVEAGARDGDTVSIYGFEFDFYQD
jgi:GTP-binding protein